VSWNPERMRGELSRILTEVMRSAIEIVWRAFVMIGLFGVF
jgi:hypothetical protein